MKQILLTILRNKNTTIDQFRNASDQLGIILAHEVANLLKKETFDIETPIKNCSGSKLKNDIVFVPILRSGMALLHPFFTFFPKSKVGFVGLQRDEKTAIASLYYEKIPPIKSSDDVIVLDPMVATGGSAIDAIKILLKKTKEEKIVFAGIIGSKEGVDRLKKTFPKIKIVIAHIDKELNDKKFIVPGLGDFGDRFFGTED